MSDDAHTLAQEAVVVSAFRNGVAVNDIATVIGKTPEAVERMLGKAGLKVVDHQKPQPQPGESAQVRIEAPRLEFSRCHRDGGPPLHGGYV